MFKHFHNYKAKYSFESNGENDFIVFKDLVQRHKKIIQHINAFNESMEFVAIFEFGQSSAQIACVLTQTSLVNIKTVYLWYIFMITPTNLRKI